jgi:hypothetical protein
MPVGTHILGANVEGTFRCRFIDWRLNPGYGVPQDGLGGDTGTGTNRYPIYGFPPTQTACTGVDLDKTTKMCRLVDQIPGTIKDLAGDILFSGIFPIYGTVPRDCCQGDVTPVPETAALYPTQGAPNQLNCTIVVQDDGVGESDSVGGTPVHSEAPWCHQFPLFFAGSSGTSGDMEYKWVGMGPTPGAKYTVTAYLVNYAPSLSLSTWQIKLVDCNGNVLLGPQLLADCQLPIQFHYQFRLVTTDCYCGQGHDYNLRTYAITVNVSGPCKPRYMARHIGYDIEFKRPVYAWAKNCLPLSSAAPGCCQRLPCRLYATITAPGSCLDGLVIPMNGSNAYSNDPFSIVSSQWSGALLGQCGLEAPGGVTAAMQCEYWTPCPDEVSESFEMNPCSGHLIRPGGNGTGTHVGTGTHNPPGTQCVQDYPMKICAKDGFKGCTNRSYQAGDLILTISCGVNDPRTAYPFLYKVHTWTGKLCSVCQCGNDEGEVVSLTFGCTDVNGPVTGTHPDAFSVCKGPIPQSITVQVTQ